MNMMVYGFCIYLAAKVKKWLVFAPGNSIATRVIDLMSGYLMLMSLRPAIFADQELFLTNQESVAGVLPSCDHADNQ